MAKRFAVINKSGVIENVIMAEDNYSAPNAVLCDEYNIGDFYRNGQFSRNPKHEPVKDYRYNRRKAYAEKEAAGELPATIEDNIDEIWKALETAELNGTELPPAASSIIRHRRAVKNKFPKDEE